MARPRVYSDEKIIAALTETMGLVYLAAQVVGCDPDTIYRRAKKSAQVNSHIAFERGKIIDTAEMKLFQAINAGEPWAIAMTLKTLGKNRGYVERMEQTGADGKDIVVAVLGPGQKMSDL
jgi:hypothetical protein